MDRETQLIQRAYAEAVMSIESETTVTEPQAMLLGLMKANKTKYGLIYPVSIEQALNYFDRLILQR